MARATSCIPKGASWPPDPTCPSHLKGVGHEGSASSAHRASSAAIDSELRMRRGSAWAAIIHSHQASGGHIVDPTLRGLAQQGKFI